jgi:hypothetical protein
MKNGKRPTREQRKLIERCGMDAHDWFVIKDTPTEMQIIHRQGDKPAQTIQKG